MLKLYGMESQRFNFIAVVIDATLPIKKPDGKVVYVNFKVVDHSIAKTKYESVRTWRESKIKSFYKIDDSYCI